MLACNAMDIHLARLSIWHTAWVLDQGHRASHERIFRDTRAFRICDGPSEVHKITAAKEVLKGYKAVDGLWPSAWLPAKREEARKKIANMLEHQIGNS